MEKRSVRTFDKYILLHWLLSCCTNSSSYQIYYSTKGRYTRWPKHCKVLKDAYGCDKLVEKDDEEKPCEGPTSGVLK